VTPRNNTAFYNNFQLFSALFVDLPVKVRVLELLLVEIFYIQKFFVICFNAFILNVFQMLDKGYKNYGLDAFLDIGFVNFIMKHTDV
jgi:hypothetical protein